MKKFLLAALLACAFETSFSEETVEMGERKVVAERVQNYTQEGSKEVNVVDSEDIENSGAQSIAEAVKSIPGVVVNDFTGSGKTVVVDLRGQGEAAKNNVAVLIDGVKQNSMDMSGSDMLTIDVSQIERIEVIKGANSVLYGDKAIGGVINIITKKGSKKEGLSLAVNGNIDSDSSNRGNIRAGYKWKKFDTALFLGNNSTEGYRDNSKLEAFDGSLNFGWSVNEANRVELRAGKHKDRYEMPGSLTLAKMEADRKQANTASDYGKTDIDDIYVQHIFKNSRVEVKSYVSKTDKENLFNMWGNERTVESERVQLSTAANVNFGKNSLTAGADYINESSEEKSNKIEKKAVSLYVFDKYRLNDKLEFNLGARREQTEFSFYTGADREYNKNIFEAGAKQFYSKSGSVYVRYAQGYRTPATDEYYEAEVPAWGIPEHYNDNLKPQTSADYEVGIKDYFNYVGEIEGTLFFSKTEDEIYYNGMHNDNMEGNTDRKGFELSLRNGFGNFSFNENISYVKTEVDGGPNDGKEVPGVPELKAAAGAVWKIGYGVEAGLNYRYIGKRYAISDLANVGGKIEGYSVTDLEVRKDIKGFKLFAGAKNIFNKKYCEYVVNYGYGANYYPSPERTVYAGVRYSY